MEIEKMFNTDLNTPKSELEGRIEKLQRKLDENNIDGTLILQKADLFYFAGTIQDAHLYVPCDNGICGTSIGSLDSTNWPKIRYLVKQ